MIFGTNTKAIPNSTKAPTKPRSSLPDETKSAGVNGSVTPEKIPTGAVGSVTMKNPLFF